MRISDWSSDVCSSDLADWLEDDRTALRLTAIGTRLRTLMDPPGVARFKHYERQARARVQRGIAMSSQGRSVFTDRLNGHILSTLLDITHVPLNHSYCTTGHFNDLITRRVDPPRPDRQTAALGKR